MDSDKVVLKFPFNESKVTSSFEVLDLFREQTTGVHLAAFLGLRDVVDSLLKYGIEPDYKKCLERRHFYMQQGRDM